MVLEIGLQASAYSPTVVELLGELFHKRIIILQFSEGAFTNHVDMAKGKGFTKCPYYDITISHIK